MFISNYTRDESGQGIEDQQILDEGNDFKELFVNC